MNDYERMARLIRHLDEHYLEQPTLAELARAAGLSPFHFHRSFAAWTGVTPKDFLQCLTLEHAKRSLRQGESVLSASLDAGLSGPGRLHDLCVNLEAASPGDIKNGGMDLTIHYGWAASPFGHCLVGHAPRGICHLSFVAWSERGGAVETLRQEWPNAAFKRHDARAAETVESIFDSATTPKNRPGLRAWVKGTPFQIRVWRALLRVPEGNLVSYGELARCLGCPQSARALGGAIGANSIALLIPCHRVIRSTGALGGYRWGSARKRALLAWEGAKCAARPRAED